MDFTAVKAGKRRENLPLILFTLNDPTISSPMRGAGRGGAELSTAGISSIPSSFGQYL